MTSARNFREELLRETLQYVTETIPFYRAHACRQARQGALELTDFPILDKRDVGKHLMELVNFERFPDYVVASGGTSGASSLSFRNIEEYEAVHYYWTGASPGTPLANDKIDSFGLDIFFNSNGHSWRKPPGWPLLSITLEQPVHAGLIRRLLCEGLVVNGRHLMVRRVQAQNGPLRVLTGYFAAEGFRPADTGIEALLVYGGHVTQEWRSRLQDYWGVAPQTLYGLSEFALGNAMACSVCGSYHYWTVWPEFFSLDWSRPVERGDAHLVLTSLLPFTRVQPRIRYFTEDIVSVTGRCSKTGELGFRFRGRSSSSAILGDPPEARVVLSETDVLEAVEPLDDVNWRTHSCETQLWSEPGRPRPPFRMGFPRYTTRPSYRGTRLAGIEIAVEARFGPDDEPRRAGALAEEVRHRLFDRESGLRPALEAYGVDLDIIVLAPDALGLRTKVGA